VFVPCQLFSLVYYLPAGQEPNAREAYFLAYLTVLRLAWKNSPEQTPQLIFPTSVMRWKTFYDTDVSVQATIPTRSWSIRVFDFTPLKWKFNSLVVHFKVTGKILHFGLFIFLGTTIGLCYKTFYSRTLWLSSLKAGAYPIETPCRCFTLGPAPALIPKHWTRLERLARDKHSSLFQKS
jgi:hypothetical protein